VKKDDAGLFEAIKLIANTMSEVCEQAKVTENEIHSTIERLISLLRDREAVLISDVETVRHQKEKELQLQKDELEFLLSGIRQAVIFSEAMVKESSDTEIVASHQQVVFRMTTLTREREKAELEPVTEAKIEFVGVEEGVDLLDSVIKELGTVVSTGISAEQSIIEMLTQGNHYHHHPTNEAYSFKVILVDKKGNTISSEMMRQSIKSLAVEEAGLSSYVNDEKENIEDEKKDRLLLAQLVEAAKVLDHPLLTESIFISFTLFQ